MAWMNLSEYFVIEQVARDRLADLRQAQPAVDAEEALISKVARVLYITSALRARPRAIDRYIDYFGDRTSSRPWRVGSGLRGLGSGMVVQPDS